MNKTDLKKRALALARKDLEKKAIELAKSELAKSAAPDETPEERFVGEYIADVEKLLQDHPRLVNEFEIKTMLDEMSEEIEKSKTKIDGLTADERRGREYCTRMGMNVNFGDRPAVPLDVIPEGFDMRMPWLREFRNRLKERAASDDFQAREAHMDREEVLRQRREAQQSRPQPQQPSWFVPRRRGLYWCLDD